MGSLPAVQTVAAADVPDLGPLVQQVVEFTQTAVGIGWTSTLPGGLGQTFIDAEAQKMLSGQSTPEQVGESQQKEFESYKSENG